jgi:hypothetical protein
MQAAVRLHTRSFLIGHCAKRYKIFGGRHAHAFDLEYWRSLLF